MGKGEIAHYEQFLLFPQYFQKVCFPGASKGVVVWEWVKFGFRSHSDKDNEEEKQTKGRPEAKQNMKKKSENAVLFPNGKMILNGLRLHIKRDQHLLFSSPEHIVLRVSYCDRSLSVRPSIRPSVSE